MAEQHSRTDGSAADGRVIVVIPARMASSRLPGKPLADICGTPMIVHVWRRAVAARVGTVLVATPDAEIVEAVRKAGGNAVETGGDLTSGSDRVAAALARVDMQKRFRTGINLQGDLPDISPEAIARCLVPLTEPAVDIATLAAPIT
ncbi:MAG: cytidylyltransferase domain-containing protein, partial [Hyphomicrobiales bacterium]